MTGFRVRTLFASHFIAPDAFLFDYGKPQELLILFHVVVFLRSPPLLVKIKEKLVGGATVQG